MDSVRNRIAVVKETMYCAMEGFHVGDRVLIIDSDIGDGRAYSLHVVGLYPGPVSRVRLHGWCSPEDLDHIGTEGMELCELYGILVEQGYMDGEGL